MLYTIAIGSRISVQGELVAILDTGEILVRDGTKTYCGRPVARLAGAPSLVAPPASTSAAA